MSARRRDCLRALGLVGAGLGLGRPAAASIDARDEAELQRLLQRGTTCSLVPDEIEGPFPLRQLLDQPVLMRTEIHEGLPGVPLKLRLRVVDARRACAPLPASAVYLWHCDRDGAYSGYDRRSNAGQSGRTFLRGIQRTDARGEVSFSTVFPGWYRGRVSHLHLMVVAPGQVLGPRVGSAVTTQLAFPAEVVRAVYDDPRYPRGPNRGVPSNEADMAFRDGQALQLLAMSGSPAGTLYGAITLAVGT